MNSQLTVRSERWLSMLLDDESGQDMAEYAILIGLVALAVIASVVVLGGTIATVFNDIGSTLPQ